VSPDRLGRVNGALAVPVWIAVGLVVVWLLAGCAVSFHVQRDLPDLSGPSEKAPDGKGRRD
jgi:hypothetical protein